MIYDLQSSLFVHPHKVNGLKRIFEDREFGILNRYKSLLFSEANETTRASVQRLNSPSN